MSATIIPFARRVPTETHDLGTSIPAPFVRARRSCGGVATFYGTKEQLQAWGVVPEEELWPVPPKRTNCEHERSHGGFISIKALRNGLYSASLHAARDEDDYRAYIDRLVRKAEEANTPAQRKLAALMNAMTDWSCSMIGSDGYRAGLWEAMNKPERQLEHAMIELALYRAPEEPEGGAS